MDFVWCAALVLCTVLSIGACVGYCWEKVERLQQTVKDREAECARWAASNADLKAKLKRRKGQLLKALVRLECGKE